ncbi:FCD domain-containing protein [Nocardia sp. NPDC059091]|uniref:FCD domain-containing protein n=1 Tax=Nocardia sp. NPDC059091 TaxID=3346724 RepID=UPI003685C702
MLDLPVSPPGPYEPRATSDDHSNFHLSVAEFAGDPVLVLIGHAVRDITVDIFNEERVPSLGDQLAISHSQIRDAIARGSAAKAEKLMRGHLEEYVTLLETNHRLPSEWDKAAQPFAYVAR